MASRQKARIGIVGASGYAGGELIRILTSAPEMELTYLASETFAGKPVQAAFPGASESLPEFSKFDPERAIKECDALFLAQSNGEAMKTAGCFVKAGKKVVDLSADFRLRDKSLYPDWYGFAHTDAINLAYAIYGLPEMNRERIRKANLVANPGCYPTAAILALAPLIEERFIDIDSVIVDAKSGVSGAGRSKVEPDFLFTELNESLKAYGVGGKHRHIPEIEQELSLLAGKAAKVTFTPHLAPMTRGLLSTCYAILTSATGDPAPSLFELYTDHYRTEPFVRVLEIGSQPNTKATLGTNQCHIGLAVDVRTNRVIVTSALDNLGKGAAGQAVQNMNLMLGFPETHALEASGLWP
jgi:N-acetyl-gamma-glutamyl-phosphate reductase